MWIKQLNVNGDICLMHFFGCLIMLFLIQLTIHTPLGVYVLPHTSRAKHDVGGRGVSRTYF